VAVPGVFFVQYAKELNLDIDQFISQSKSSMLRDKVRQEFADGRALGVEGTPTFFLNGEKMVFQTYDAFVQQVVTAVDPSLVPSSEATQPAAVNEVKFGL